MGHAPLLFVLEQKRDLALKCQALRHSGVRERTLGWVAVSYSRVDTPETLPMLVSRAGFAVHSNHLIRLEQD